MRHSLVAVTLVAAVGAGIAVLASSDDDDAELRTPVLAASERPPKCPKPRVTNLDVRPVGEDGERIALRVRAEMARPGIGAFDVMWGNRSGLSADGWWGRRAATEFQHRYPRPGTYRITVVAEGSTEACKRLKKSAPATLRVRVPLSRTRDRSSP